MIYRKLPDGGLAACIPGVAYAYAYPTSEHATARDTESAARAMLRDDAGRSLRLPEYCARIAAMVTA